MSTMEQWRQAFADYTVDTPTLPIDRPTPKERGCYLCGAEGARLNAHGIPLCAVCSKRTGIKDITV